MSSKPPDDCVAGNWAGGAAHIPPVPQFVEGCAAVSDELSLANERTLTEKRGDNAELPTLPMAMTKPDTGWSPEKKRGMDVLGWPRGTSPSEIHG
jgi:hypothetical protein